MSLSHIRITALSTVVLIVTVSTVGCASLPRGRGTIAVEQQAKTLGLPTPYWKPPDSPASPLPPVSMNQPLTLDATVRLAFERNPRIRELYAQLGLAQADVQEAARLSNPRLGYASLKDPEQGGSQVTRSLSLEFTDLLLLPARSRLARGAFENARIEVTRSLLELARDVEVKWYESVGAEQSAQMRAMIAEATETSSQLAQRLHEAGNITPRNLALELAASTEAKIAAAETKAAALRARAELANAIGLSVADKWRTSSALPAPPSQDDALLRLDPAVDSKRLDLQVAKREVEIAADALHFTRRWRWLGLIEVGYERESETDGAVIRGPTIAWEIPLFNQNQSGVLRSEVAVERAQTRLSALELSVRNDFALASNRLETARQIAESYRTALLPQREAVVACTFEEFNYMLKDAFELLQAKRDQYAAYEDYLAAVRDYWIARSDLRRAIGGPLPGDEKPLAPSIGAETLLGGELESAKPETPGGHSQHHGGRP